MKRALIRLFWPLHFTADVFLLYMIGVSNSDKQLDRTRAKALARAERAANFKLDPAEDGPRSSALLPMLAGKRILIIGDSTSRYEYLSLAYLAEYGMFAEGNNVTCSSSGVRGPNPIFEGLVTSSRAAPDVARCIMEGLQWSTASNGTAFDPAIPGSCSTGQDRWIRYYKYTSSMLNGGEACDCYRSHISKGSAIENRAFRRSSISITYVQWFGKVMDPHGSRSLTLLDRGGSGADGRICPTGWGSNWTWRCRLDHCLQAEVYELRPTHLFMSVGYWKNPANFSTFLNSVANASAYLRRTLGTEVFWRTTPGPRHGAKPWNPDATTLEMFSRSGIRIWDAKNAVSELQERRKLEDGVVFADGIHLSPWMQNYLVGKLVPTLISDGAYRKSEDTRRRDIHRAGKIVPPSSAKILALLLLLLLTFTIFRQVRAMSDRLS